MKPYWTDGERTIYFGDCREILPELDRVSAIVTDPPYELGFMGKSWDSKGISFQKETWQIIRNVCLSGASLLSFGGTRTFHRIACAIEDAGWEIRDTLMWVYGSGFPKSLDISKAIDKQDTTEFRKMVGFTIKSAREKKDLTMDDLCNLLGLNNEGHGGMVNHYENGRATPTIELWRKIVDTLNITEIPDYENQKNDRLKEVGIIKNPISWFGEGVARESTTPEAQLWEGYGTALKPAYEPIILAMNPLDGTFANNALKHGVAGLNIDGCRVETDEQITNHSRGSESAISKGKYGDSVAQETHQTIGQQIGRFPANFIHDGSQQVMELFPNPHGAGCARSKQRHTGDFGVGFYGDRERLADNRFGDSGSAARFFYCAKSSKAERNKGCEELEDSIGGGMQGTVDKTLLTGSGNERNNVMKNNHPTVKPLALMEYLVKLVKMPEYNLIIDPFMGSGSTLLACIRLGIPCIGIDNDEKSCEIAAKRCSQE